MDSDQIAMVDALIEDAVKPIREALATLESKLNVLEKQVDDFESTDFASADHYHDELASADHVERSEGDFRRQLSRLQEKVNDVEYKVHDAERKAERAQSAAESAQRSARGGW